MKKEEMKKEEMPKTQYQFDFEKAHQRIEPMLLPTPLIESPFFSELCNNQVFLKPENLQQTGAFKIRGASNKILQLSKEQKTKGLITASAGNHAQGVACAAKASGARAIVVMPETTPLLKVQRTKNYGAEVVLHGPTFDDAAKEAARLSKEHGYVFVHPFNDPEVIEGQGTIALEIVKQVPNLNAILVPVGGGGLIAGIAAYCKSVNKDIRVIGVEPETAASMKYSISQGSVQCLKSVNTIADGTAVKQPGDLTYKMCTQYVDDWITVNDYEVMEAFTDVVEQHKLVVEPSGLLSVAALNKLRFANKKVACVLSGGNVDMLMISEIITKGLTSHGRIFKFSIAVPDAPGQLTAVTKILADNRANIIKVNHDKFAITENFSDILLSVTCSTNGNEHINSIKKAFVEAGYKLQTNQ